MKMFLKSVAGVLTAAASLCASSQAAQLPSRIAGQIDTSERVELTGTATHRPATSTVVGHLPGNTPLTRMSLVLAPSAAQEADLTRLLADQVNPASANYHNWLTPAQFGARFGVSDADLAKIQGWLSSQGFTDLSVAPSRNTVFFSGTAATVESAFGVTMQQYRRNGETFFENSSNVRVPAALQGVVSGVSSLSSYRLKSNLAKRAKAMLEAHPNNTVTGTDGTVSHYLVPWDFRQIYGLNTLFNGGFTGQVKIAVVGQSAVNTTQIGYFQQLTGAAVTAPTLVQVPNSGTSTFVSGDEGESEIDIEYAGGTASGATIEFVYTGNGNNNGVFDSVIYAVTSDLAPIITMSYGGCETDYSTYAAQTFEPYLQQANAQGQTVLVSSGDADAATCDADDSSNAVTTAVLGATVSYPASSPYVTAVGGTRFNEGAGNDWSSTNNSFAGSAIGYIPEIAWNETADPTNIEDTGGEISGSGGGASALFGKPSWQTGTGVPADGARDVPDVAFNAAVDHDPYLYCSAEVTDGQEQETCTASDFGAYIVGGTSLSAPNFAGMLAIVEQRNGGTRLGNINPALYSLAAASASPVFNDVISGDNTVPCVTGTPDCTTGTLGFTTNVGYDQVTGWGSVNGAALATGVASLPATAPVAPSVTVSPNAVSPIINTPLTFTAAVTSAATSTVPSGTVQFTIDGASAGTVTLASGSASYTLSSGFTTAGTHTIVAAYSGDNNFHAASSTLTLTVGASVSSNSGTFTLTSSPSTLSIATGSSGSETLTVTPAGGFLGVINFAATASGTGTLNACYNLGNATVSSGQPTGSATMTIYTSTSDCATAERIPLRTLSKTKLARNSQPGGPQLPRKPAAVLLAGALLGCFAFRRRSRLPLLFTLALCAALIPGMGCGSGGSTSPINGGSGGTGTGGGGGTTGTNFTITVTGQSQSNSNLTSSTSFTLNVQ